MTFAEDIADDWDVFDGVEDVTFLQRNDVAPAGNVACKGLIESRSNDNTLIQLAIAHDCIAAYWNLWALNVRPKIDSRITTTGGEVWIVKHVERNTLGTRWRVACIEAG